MGIKASIQKLLGARRRIKEPVRDTYTFPRMQQMGLAFNQKSQMKSSPPNIRYFTRTPYVRAAIRRIRDPLSSLEWEIVPTKGVKTSRALRKQIDIVTNCLQHPNNEDSWRTMFGQIVEDCMTYGGGIFEQQIGTDPIRPLWMWAVDAQSIQIFPGWSGAPNEARYLQTIGYSNVGMLQGRKLRNEEIIYVKINDSTETPYGFGPVEIAFQAINRVLGVEDFAGNLASNAQPQFFLHFPDADVEKLRAVRDYWRNEVEAQGLTPIFGGKEKPTVERLYPGGDEALYLKYQEFIMREIATAFGLSPMNLGLEADVNRNTAEVSADRDWDNTIIPLAELFASYITREAIHSRLSFYQLEFKFVGLYREDEESTSNIYQTYYKNNMITPNEQRLKLGLEPMVNQWADLTFADTQIALAAARGAAVLEDQNLNNDGTKGVKPTTSGNTKESKT